MFHKRKNMDVSQDSTVDEIKPLYLPSGLPSFGIRRRAMFNIGKEKIGYELTRDYHIALLKATINALNCDTIEIAADEKNIDNSTCELEYPFVRDPAIILHDKGLILSTQGNQFYGSKDIIRKTQEITGYQSLIIADAYFEGGNVFYFPTKKTLFHGLNPVGHYKSGNPEIYSKDTHGISYKVDPISQTNQQLRKTLKPLHISVYGLEWSSKLLVYKNGTIHHKYYYHLDCFMQSLPDGRVIILNQKILTKKAQIKMKETFSDNFIDLAYSEYLTQPLLFNFIAIPQDDTISIISAELPPSVIATLAELNLKVITPSSLDSRNPCYDQALAKRVVSALRKEGFDTMDEKNLGTHLAVSTKGYLHDNGIKYGAELHNKVVGQNNIPIDKYFSQKKLSFSYSGGGPHCFTTEIIASKFNVNPSKKPKILRTNKPTFFKESLERNNLELCESMELKPQKYAF